MKVLVTYLITILLFIGFSYLFVDQNMDFLSVLYSGLYSSQRIFLTILYVVLVLVLFALYVYLLRQPMSWGTLRKYLMLSFPLVLAYPAMLSFDIFNYILTAKVTYFYGENPYIVMPIEIPNEPMLAYTHAANKIALYGPFWIVSTFIPHFLGLGSILLTMFTFKLFITGFYFGIVLLLYRLTHEVRRVAFFALNPLVFIETFVSGHNDVVMMFFALLAIFLLREKRYVTSFLSLLSSLLVKYATVFLVPLFAWILIQKVRKRAVDIEQIGVIGFVSMMAIFLLSPLREEVYPWYAIWLLPFASLCFKNRLITYGSVALSFGMMLRYVPFMALGTHFGVTPLIKIVVVVIPVMITLMYIFISSKSTPWKKEK